MKISELKKLLKPLVRECINEVLAEQYLRTLSEGARPSRQSTIGDDEPPAPRTVSDILAPHANSKPNRKQSLKESVSRDELRARLKEHSIADDSDMAILYEDSLKYTVPAQEKGNDVSEAMMQKVGVYDKDYSKYL